MGWDSPAAHLSPTEPTIASMTRGLAATAFLMARTPVAAQPWRAAYAAVEMETGSRRTRLRVDGSAPREATVIWETSGRWPSLSLTFGPDDAPEWIEAEALWPDGRRVFAVSDAAGERE